jgi:hypothetical protein
LAAIKGINMIDKISYGHPMSEGDEPGTVNFNNKYILQNRLRSPMLAVGEP